MLICLKCVYNFSLLTFRDDFSDRPYLCRNLDRNFHTVSTCTSSEEKRVYCKKGNPSALLSFKSAVIQMNLATSGGKKAKKASGFTSLDTSKGIAHPY